MGMKEYAIAFTLAGKLSSNFAKTFNAASQTMKGFGDRARDMNRVAAEVGGVVKLRQEALAVAKRATQQKKALDAVTESIRKSRNPTQTQIVLQKKLEREYQTTRSVLDRNVITLKKAEQATKTNGVSLQTLIDRQKKLQAAADRTTKSLEKQAKINEFNEKVKAAGSAGNTRLAAGAVAAGGAGIAVIKGGAEITASLNQMQARVGATDEEMAKLSKTAKEIYASGLGESFDDIARVMSNAKQVTGLMGTELKNASQNAIMMRKTFDIDVNEGLRASSSLMKNFGKAADEAYGLMALAAQKGANKNGDLADTFNEYSVHYKALGLSAEQFTAHLIAGAQDGTFSIDKVGDAIKELNIRAKDGSKKSVEAFQALGMNGDKMTQAFAAGGDKAQEAFFKTIEAIKAVKDPVKQNEIGVALLGTQFEDLEKGALDSLLAMKNASVDSKEALNALSKANTKDLGTQITVVTRQLQLALAPAAEAAASILASKMPEIGASIGRLTPVITSVATSFASALPGIIDSVAGAIDMAVSFAQVIAHNWGWIGPIVKTAAISFLSVKAALLLVVSPALRLYSTFLKLRDAILFVKSSTKLLAVAQKGATVASYAFRAAQLAAAGAMKVARLAMAGFNLVMAANPIALVVLAMAGLIAIGIALWKNWDTVKAKASELWATVKSAFQSGIESIKTWLANFNLFESGKKIIDTLVSGIKSVASAPVKAVGEVFAKVRDLLPFSDAKEGPLSQLTASGQAIMSTIGSGIKKAGSMALTKPFEETAGGLFSGGLNMDRSGAGTGGTVSVNFAPVININGGSNGDAYADVKRGLAEGQKNLKKELERLLANQRRLSYV